MTQILILLVVAMVPILLIVASIVAYNRLVRDRMLVREAFSGIDVQLKRRHDLIPQLVRVVEQYARHEQGLLTEIARRRSAAVTATSREQKQTSEAMLSGALGSMLAVAESYPELRSDQHFLNLMLQLSEVEDDLQKSRRYYNGTVRELNTRVEMFPSNLFAALFGFHIEPFFMLDRLSEAQVPSVHISKDSPS